MQLAPHVDKLKAGREAWNAWRADEPDVTPMLMGGEYDGLDLSGYDLSASNLNAARMISCELRETNLEGANLGHVNMRGVNLKGAILRNADVSDGRLSWTDLESADLSHADLRWTDLTRSNLMSASIDKALLLGTTFADADLSNIRGAASCKHLGSSFVDHLTLCRSLNVPEAFWRGCGLPDALIDYLPSLVVNAVQFYSCFISYSSTDQEFAERFHADLQENGVRCWYAPHDLEIGKKILDGIDEAIRMREKVVLVLSDAAIASDWVEDEVVTAFEEERLREETVLFPIRLDDAVIETSEAWASKLRARNIGDFTNWNDHNAYMVAFERALRDLRAKR